MTTETLAAGSPAVGQALTATPLSGWPDPARLFTSLGGQLDGLISAGGPVVVILGLMSVVALAIVLLKLWQFSALRLGRTVGVEAALAHWYGREPAAALAAVGHSRQPVERVLAVALAGLARPGSDRALLREELLRLAGGEMERLRGSLRALEVIGTLSPLLGLLGTVLGMIEAFRQLEAAGPQVDPALLSGGIWQALLTTAVGLAVAIPAVLAHGWLEGRVERCGHRLEDAVTRAFTRDLGLGPADAAPALIGEPQPVHGHAV